MKQNTPKVAIMDHLGYITNKRRGKHLNYEERIKIETLSKIGIKSERIAKEIGCSGRTVRRELAKGRTQLLNTDLTVRTEYSADIGQQKYDYAATAKGPMLKIGKNYKLVEEIERLIIQEKMSPYAAAECIKKSNKGETVISYKSIYNLNRSNALLCLQGAELAIDCNLQRER